MEPKFQKHDVVVVAGSDGQAILTWVTAVGKMVNPGQNPCYRVAACGTEELDEEALSSTNLAEWQTAFALHQEVFIISWGRNPEIWDTEVVGVMRNTLKPRARTRYVVRGYEDNGSEPEHEVFTTEELALAYLRQDQAKKRKRVRTK